MEFQRKHTGNNWSESQRRQNVNAFLRYCHRNFDKELTFRYVPYSFGVPSV